MNIASNQAFVFFIFVLTGIIIGLIFDVFRALRKSFKTKDYITYIEDIVFWIIVGILLMYVTFKYNYGEIRFYMFLGTFLGGILYLLIFSKVFIGFLIKIFMLIKKVVNTLIIIPIKKLIKIVKKPIKFIIINIQKSKKFLQIKINNVKKIKCKKRKQDFLEKCRK